MKTCRLILLVLAIIGCAVNLSWAGFPTTLTNAVDGETEIFASHLNNIEAKIGIDNSAVTTSLDYLLRHGSSINPGHKHTPAYGGTGVYSYTVGDLLYASGAATLAKLADVAVGQVLTSGGVGTAPAWSASPTITTSVTVPTVYGSAVADGDLTLGGTSHGTKTTSDVILQPTAGNVRIGPAAVGTTSNLVVGLSSGTAPTTSPADMAQMWVQDQAAGNACYHFRTELGDVLKLYKQANIAVAKTDYTAGDLDTEAEVITALNTTNTKLNAILTILQNSGTMAAP